MLCCCYVYWYVLPRERFDYNKAPYKPYKWEIDTTLYEKIKISKWKDKIPDISLIFKNLLPKKISEIHISTADVKKLIAETCVAEISHVVLLILSVRILFMWEGSGGFWFFVIYGILGNIPFILVQRYNRPRLIKLLHRLEKKDENFNSDM